MIPSPRLAFALVVGAVFLTGCIGYSTTGGISGRLVAVGGPSAKPRPLRGTIYITGDNGNYLVRVPPDAAGSFYAAVKEGTYSVRGRSPAYQGGGADCLPDHSQVSVGADQGVTVVVKCQLM